MPPFRHFVCRVALLYFSFRAQHTGKRVWSKIIEWVNAKT